MQDSESNISDNPDHIYFYRSDIPYLDTSIVFDISEENGNLRVKNKYVNCLFRNLTRYSFDVIYNEYIKYLNLDFRPMTIGNKVYNLTEEEKEKLICLTITSWIYFYTVNNLTVAVRRADFLHPYMVDYVLSILDKKFGIDTEISLALGAKILRQNSNEYTGTVKGRRWYYDR